MWFESAVEITLTSRGHDTPEHFRRSLSNVLLSCFRYFGSVSPPHPLPPTSPTQSPPLMLLQKGWSWHALWQRSCDTGRHPPAPPPLCRDAAEADGEFSQVQGGEEANACAFKCASNKWTLANLNASDDLEQTKCRHRDSPGPVCAQVQR